MLDMLPPTGAAVEIVGLEFAQRTPAGDGLRRRSRARDGDEHEQAGENGAEI